MGGYLGREPDFEAIKALKGREIWLDIGARRASDAIDCLISGAEMAFLNTRNLKGFEELKKAQDLSDSIGVTLDLDEEGKVVMGLLRCDLTSFLGRILDMEMEMAIMVHSHFPIGRLMNQAVGGAYLCGSFRDLGTGIFKGLIEEF